MDENQLVVAGRKVDVLFENCHLVSRIPIQADLADAEHVWLVQKFRNNGKDLASQRQILRFLGVDAQPAIMR